ncbi:hypothetical protein [Bacillus salipaludis]|uniref:Uncharacterized protein n=1 Tax=Bacillus salipaludis TaxID=2547811 RepID=A0AA90QNK2_9BACI|nr:hypothetical protein [Bacillus salipaludis]MDQ6595292.1 hypothetical protein [Bacillus salipaludis]
MEGNRLLLTDFTSDEGFELTRYITHLFEYVSSLQKNNNPQFKPAQE